MPFSDYIAYFDESGDHGLQTIDAGFPVFVLCGCLFKIDHYLKRELSVFSAIKFAHFGHDAVVFHSRDIRKRIGPFQILANPAKRQEFMDHIALTGESMTCVFEQPGKTEDDELAGEFVRICAGQNYWGELPFKMAFANKLANMPGLQIADLAAYPIARHIIAPDSANPAYDAIMPRIRKSPSGKMLGWGLKVFP